MESLYTIVALPECNTLNLLNSLRERIYAEYLTEPRKPRSIVHITLAQLETTTPKDERIVNGMSQIGKKYLPLSLSDISIKTDPKNADSAQSISNWIGLDIKSKELQDLSRDLQHYLQEMGIDDTTNYLKRAGFKNQIPLHFTLCPSCVQEKTQEVTNIIRKTIPKEIVINTLALRTEAGEILMEKPF